MNQQVNSSRTYYLFEYGDPVKLDWEQTKFLRFQAFLEEIWENRSRSGIIADWYKAEEDPLNQPLVQCIHKRKGVEDFEFAIRASNYVGMIRFEDDVFHFLPKLFKKHVHDDALNSSNAHLLWWLSYNKWLNLPKHIASLSNQRCDFLEILIHLFSTYTLDQLNMGPYQAYQEMEAETTYLKGQLMFSDYISNYLGRANYQKLYCRYDSFEIDNTFNRIIKSVCKQLMHHTRLRKSRNNLNDILRILDEVSDTSVTIQNCDEVVLNRMFGDYQLVLDYCRMFLANSQTTSNDQQSNAFAFLVPMEKVFEEFVLGFIRKEMKDSIHVDSQLSGTYLTTKNTFKLRPDLKMTALKEPKSSFIADSKYKLLYDNAKGISQPDLYQMIAYAIRFNVNRIVMFYPKWTGGSQIDEKHIEILDELASEEIQIQIHSLEIMENIIPMDEHVSIQRVFELTRNRLIKQLESVIISKG